MQTLTEVKQRPILFSTEMVKAILAYIKGQTRRTTGLELINQNPDDWQFEWAEPRRNVWTFTQKSTLTPENLESRDFTQVQIKCKYGCPDDILYVRETWLKYEPEHYYRGEKYAYKADVENTESDDFRKEYIKAGYPYKWKSSLHMPKEAARIFLQIESIRVERLQSITEYDARCEGADKGIIRRYKTNDWQLELNNSAEYKQGFEFIWKRINGEISWILNPWVWVITFKQIEKP